MIFLVNIHPWMLLTCIISSRVGEKVKARVLGLDYYSEVAVCTLQKALLSGLSKIDNLTIG